MKLFEGKTPAERNKHIAAIVLGAMALLALAYNIVGLYTPSRKTTVAVVASPTPSVAPKTNSDITAIPSREEENFVYTTTPVVYTQGANYAPDAGRNIFAFYEPPPPTPYSPTPVIVKPQTPIPPKPTPTPDFLLGFVTPQEVYAGSKSFRLEVSGDKYTPNSIILFNGSQLPTTFISPQKLVADIPANLIAGAGPKQIMVVSPDGKLFSNQILLNVQAPPQPQLQYIGAKLAQRNNNNTAYFREQGKNTEFGARLNDTVGGRFKVASISKEEVVLEDTSLGFRYKLPLYRPPPGQTASTNPAVSNPVNNYPGRGVNQYNPNQPNYAPPQGEIPGIPGNIQRYTVPQPPTPQPQPAKPQDDDDDNN